MKNSELDQQDHGKTTGIDVSTMTIEFLRARLLSERSVSSSARRRAEELSKRVAELEEQLNVVLSQKKMAEKAASEVLAILEDNRISDISETVDSVSDESKVGEDANSVNGKEHSNSDQESSSVLGGSLSWKGRKSSPSSLEKLKDFSTRRRSSSVSIVSSSSSPKHHHQGRSCRKIKRRETRSLNEESKSKAVEVCTQENATAISLEDSPNRSDDRPRVSREGSGTPEEVLSDGQLLGSSQDQRKDGEIKNSLEHEMQPIDHYEEAMEKAQREWEEKFRENNNCTLDSCDQGNHSDITEERYEIQAQTPTPSNVPSLDIKEAKSQVEESETYISRDSSQAQPNVSLPPSSVSPENKSITPSHALTEVNLTQNNPENHQHQPSYYINQQNYQTSNHVLSDAAINGHNSKSDNLYALVPHQPAPLDGVLDALKKARLSLQKKIEHMPLIERGETAAPRIGDRVEIPVSSAELFRLPTDFSDSQLRSESNRFVSSRYTDTIQSFSRDDFHRKDLPSSNLLRDDRFLSSRFSELGPRFTSQKQSHFDQSYMDAALPSSSGMYNYPLLPELTWVPSNEGFSRTFPSGKFATPPFKQYAFYDDQIMRRNMYR